MQKHSRLSRLFSLALCLPLALAAQSAPAQEQDLNGKVLVELNAASTQSGDAQACTLSFFVTNGLEADLESFVLETVMFDANGQVDQLTLFDFGVLPVARPRVRQFSIAGRGCDQLSRILLNGVQSCVGGGATPASCTKALVPASRTDIEVIG